MQNEKFSKSQDPIEERIVHLEETLPSLARLREQQDLFAMSHALSDKQVEMMAIQKEDEEKIEKISYSLKTLMPILNENKSIHDSKLDKIKSIIETSTSDVKQSLEMQKTQIFALANHKEILTGQIKELKSCIDNHPDIAKVSKSLSSLDSDHEKTKKNLDIVLKKSEVHASTLTELLLYVKELQRSIEALKSDLQEEKKTNQKNHAEMIKGDEQCRSFILTAQSQFSSEMKALVSSAAVIDKNPVDAVKEDFAKQLQPVSFDAKNANLRSSNNEAKIMLLEKKVEQLFLLKSQADLRS